MSLNGLWIPVEEEFVDKFHTDYLGRVTLGERGSHEAMYESASVFYALILPTNGPLPVGICWDERSSFVFLTTYTIDSRRFESQGEHKTVWDIVFDWKKVE